MGRKKRKEWSINESTKIEHCYKWLQMNEDGIYSEIYNIESNATSALEADIKETSANVSSELWIKRNKQQVQRPFDNTVLVRETVLMNTGPSQEIEEVREDFTGRVQLHRRQLGKTLVVARNRDQYATMRYDKLIFDDSVYKYDQLSTHITRIGNTRPRPHIRAARASGTRGNRRRNHNNEQLPGSHDHDVTQTDQSGSENKYEDSLEEHVYDEPDVPTIKSTSTTHDNIDEAFKSVDWPPPLPPRIVIKHKPQVSQLHGDDNDTFLLSDTEYSNAYLAPTSVVESEEVGSFQRGLIDVSDFEDEFEDDLEDDRCLHLSTDMALLKLHSLSSIDDKIYESGDELSTINTNNYRQTLLQQNAIDRDEPEGMSSVDDEGTAPKHVYNTGNWQTKHCVKGRPPGYENHTIELEHELTGELAPKQTMMPSNRKPIPTPRQRHSSNVYDQEEEATRCCQISEFTPNEGSLVRKAFYLKNKKTELEEEIQLQNDILKDGEEVNFLLEQKLRNAKQVAKQEMNRDDLEIEMKNIKYHVQIEEYYGKTRTLLQVNRLNDASTHDATDLAPVCEEDDIDFQASSKIPQSNIYIVDSGIVEYDYSPFSESTNL